MLRHVNAHKESLCLLIMIENVRISDTEKSDVHSKTDVFSSAEAELSDLCLMGTQYSLVRKLHLLLVSMYEKERQQRQLGILKDNAVTNKTILLRVPGEDVVGTEGLMLPDCSSWLPSGNLLLLLTAYLRLEE